MAKRSTIYFDPQLHKALRLKAAHTERSVSDLVNDAGRRALREDQEDLAASAHPGKVDVERMRARLAVRGFALERTERARVLHYDFLHEEEILVFRAQ